MPVIKASTLETRRLEGGARGARISLILDHSARVKGRGSTDAPHQGGRHRAPVA